MRILLELLALLATLLVVACAVWAVLWMRRDRKRTSERNVEILRALERAYGPTKNGYVTATGFLPDDIDTQRYTVEPEIRKADN